MIQSNTSGSCFWRSHSAIRVSDLHTIHPQLRVEFFNQDRSERAGCEPPAFMAATETTPSTMSVCESLIKCMEKGCLTDVLPFEQKYINLKPHSKSGLPDRMNKQVSRGLN